MDPSKGWSQVHAPSLSGDLTHTVPCILPAPVSDDASSSGPRMTTHQRASCEPETHRGRGPPPAPAMVGASPGASLRPTDRQVPGHSSLRTRLSLDWDQRKGRCLLFVWAHRLVEISLSQPSGSAEAGTGGVGNPAIPYCRTRI